MSGRRSGQQRRIDRSLATARSEALELRRPLPRLRVTSFLPRLSLAAIVVFAAALAAVYAVRATHWAVMTDELQTAKLATSIARTLSPIPSIHGVYFPALSQLYPLLMSPFFAALSPPAAVTAVHALNGVLLASAAVPAYLLARSVTGSRPAAIVAAAMTAFTPWLVLSATLLTENAAYPAFVWSVFLCYRAMAAPGIGNDLGACAGLALAFFARTQLVVLALVFPAALLAHELAYAAGRAGTGRRIAAAREALARTISAHQLLAAVYAGGAVVAGVLAARSSADALLGTYGGAVHGSVFPAGIWRSALTHFDHTVTGAGVVPFLLAAAWALSAVVRPERKSPHAFAVLSLLLVPVLTIEVTSFDLRYAGNQFEQDRYLFYVVALLAVGAAAALTERRHVRLRAGLVAVVAAVFVVGDTFVSYRDTLIWWAAPAAAFHPTLADAGGVVGLSAGTFVRLAVAVLAVVLLAALLRGPGPAALWACGLAVAAFGAFQAGWEFHRYVVPSLTVRSTVADRDWIDAAAPSSSSVALVPSPWVPASAWWEAEFWNKDVDRVLRVGRRSIYTPFPAGRVNVDFASGRLVGDRGPTAGLLVLARHESRFALAGATSVAKAGALVLVRAPGTARLAWAMRGAGDDGWIRANRRATIRIFAGDVAVRRDVDVTTTAPIPARTSRAFGVATGRSTFRTVLGPGGRISVRFVACVPAHDFVDATVGAGFSARIRDGRRVSLHVDEIHVRPAPAAAACGPIRAVGG